MKKENTHPNRESWLQAAVTELRPYFEKLGHPLPEKIRVSVGFPSSGKRGRRIGECWHPAASADGHYEIYIRVDVADPVDVLGVLMHELVHTLLPPTVKHGKEFREIALRVGLAGPMRQASPGPLLTERVHALAAALGPFPHAKLNFSGASDVPKKQAARYLKAECGAACGYCIRITAKWARAGLPICPVDAQHGVLKCDIPDENGDDEN